MKTQYFGKLGLVVSVDGKTLKVWGFNINKIYVSGQAARAGAKRLLLLSQRATIKTQSDLQKMLEIWEEGGRQRECEATFRVQLYPKISLHKKILAASDAAGVAKKYINVLQRGLLLENEK